ncbi:MAG: hypothetical protein ACM36C_14520 [Acidobacteriota bacterium]
MHTLFNRSLTAAAVTLVFTGAAFATQASKPASSSTPTKTAAVSTSSTAKSSKASSASHSAMGTIEKYDANMLTLKTSSGEEQFMVASSAHVRDGSKTIKADQLSSLTGQKAKVRYVESNGQRTAESVMVSSGSEHKAAPKSKTTKG